MSLTTWIVFIVLAAAAGAFAWWLYRAREPAVRGRTLLTALRALALALVLLLLFDPRLPGARAGESVPGVLIDASLSMRAPLVAGGTRWDSALARTRTLAAGSGVLLFGATPRTAARAALDSLQPAGPRSLVLPALRAAAEAGARELTIVSDGGLEDAADLAEWAGRLGIMVRFERAGGEAAANVAVAAVRAPGWVEAGDEAEVRVDIAGIGADLPDSARVVLRAGGRELAGATVAVPPAGRTAEAALTFTPEGPPSGGLVRYEVAVEPGGAVPDDDVRTLYIRAGEQPPGIAYLSFAPGWEPRFLAPVLEQSLGLPIHTFLRLRDGRFLRVGGATEAGRTAVEAEVREAAGSARLLIVDGLDSAPAWAVRAARQAPRVLVFASAGMPGDVTPAAVGAPVAGDWYIAERVPSSPVAPLLADLPLVDLTPLPRLHRVDAPGGAWAPLSAALARRGDPAPVLVAGQNGAHRWALALGEGYWQWALRGGEHRTAYRRFWSGVAGWLVQGMSDVATEPVRPVERAAPRGVPVAWAAPGLNADSIALALRGAGGFEADTVVEAARDSAATTSLPPGHYRYTATAYRGGEAVARAEGPFTVESYSPEFVRPSAQIPERAGAADGARGVDAARRPLRASVWPWLLIIGLLCAEWILRRRWGLR